MENLKVYGLNITALISTTMSLNQGLQTLVTASQEILNLAIPKIKSGVKIAEVGAFINIDYKLSERI